MMDEKREPASRKEENREERGEKRVAPEAAGGLLSALAKHRREVAKRLRGAKGEERDDGAPENPGP